MGSPVVAMARPAAFCKVNLRLIDISRYGSTRRWVRSGEYVHSTLGEKCLLRRCQLNRTNSNLMGATKVNEFNEYVRDIFSESGDIAIKPMMGGYLVYFNGKLIGDICSNELFLKRTPTSDRLLADSELRYPYEGSKTLMHVFDSFDDKVLILELLDGMYAELPEKKPSKTR